MSNFNPELEVQALRRLANEAREILLVEKNTMSNGRDAIGIRAETFIWYAPLPGNCK